MTGKRGGKRSTSWKKGQSGNPGGRPKNQESITAWIRAFGQLTGEQAAQMCELYAKQLRGAGDSLPLFALVAVRAIMSMIDNPSPGLLAQVLDRTEGRVPQTLDVNWRDQLQKIGAGDLFEQLVQYATTQLVRTDGSGGDTGSAAPADAGPQGMGDTSAS